MNLEISQLIIPLFWGAISVSGLIAGALVGSFIPLKHHTIATTMAIAAGMLLAAATVELAAEALHNISLPIGSAALLFGAIGFSSANAYLSKFGAKHRKRCRECTINLNEASLPGSGIAITLGTAMDAIPEAIVLGITLRTHGPNLALIAAIALGNIPEAISGSAGLLARRRSVKWILLLWFGVAIGTVIFTGMGYVLAGILSPNFVASVQLFGSGALIAMITETLIPEAVEGSPNYAGTIAAIGFAILLIFGSLF